MTKLTYAEYNNMAAGIGLGFEAIEKVAAEHNAKALSVENIKFILGSVQEALRENIQNIDDEE